MKKIALWFVVLLAYCSAASAQMKHMHHKPVAKDTASTKDDDDMDMGEDVSLESTIHLKSPMHMSEMSSGMSLHLPMNRDGSGTAWNPDAAPMYGYMAHAGKWMFMFHGDVFVRYNRQDITNAGSRGGDKIDAPDMLMAMAQRRIGTKGLLHFNVMLSTDALIAGGSGYPLLFQTGESWNGHPLVDRQHPHDLFSELSVSYAYALSHKADLSLYAGYPGEPALGPVTFMHRVSGQFMPDAPIGHHWADATHITFGVATLGFRYGKFKLEGSSFTGREPDENRYNFDKPLFDSWSARLSFNPSDNWALQASHGFIKSPEALHSGEDVDRTTASATYMYPINMDNYIAATALWGQNNTAGQAASNSVLLEATLKLKRLAVYGRYEWVQKSGEELTLDPIAFDPYKFHVINTVTVGLAYDAWRIGHIILAPGAQVAYYHADESLGGLYGQNTLSAEVYLRLYPAIMK